MKIKSTILLSSLLASTICANPIPPKIGDVLKEVTPPKNRAWTKANTKNKARTNINSKRIWRW